MAIEQAITSPGRSRTPRGLAPRPGGWTGIDLSKRTGAGLPMRAAKNLPACGSPNASPVGEAKGICKSKASAGTQASFENEKRKARLRKAKLRMDVAYSRMPLCKSVDAHIPKRKVVFPKTISVRSVQRRAISPFSNSVGTSNRPYMAGKPNRRSVRPSSHR